MAGFPSIAQLRIHKARALLVLATASAVVVGGVVVLTQFPAAGNDDSHITYWAAHALARFGVIVNYNGQALEQSSTLLLVGLLGAVERLTGIAPPRAFIALDGPVATRLGYQRR